MKVLLASLSYAVTGPWPAGASFGSQPDTVSSRQFESQPTKTRGRDEHTLNAQPDQPSGSSASVSRPARSSSAMLSRRAHRAR